MASHSQRDGYITLQLFDVNESGHRIKINGHDLSGEDIRVHGVADHWFTWTDVIQSDVLKKGDNTLQIVRAAGGDNFIVGNAIVNWREEV